MSDDFDIKGAEALSKLGKVLKEAGNGKELRKELLRNLRAAGKPVTKGIKSNLSEHLPHKGGLSADMSKAKVAVRNRLSGEKSGVRIDVKHAKHDITAINRGILRHPVFDHKRWVTQKVTPNLVTEAVEKRKGDMQTAVADAMETTLNKIERSV